MESESAPHLISPFETAVQHGKEDHHSLIPHPHIPIPHLHAHTDSNDAAVYQPNTGGTATLDQHPQIQRARQKAKARYLQSPLLEAEEYIFPRFSCEELSLGKVLGRGGFGTVLEVRKFLLPAAGHDAPLVDRGISACDHVDNGRTTGGLEKKIPAVRQVKSFDALGEIQPSASRDDEADQFGEVRMCTSHEEPTLRKRRSVSLGFGSRHVFFRGGKLAGRDHRQSLQNRMGQAQIEEQQFKKKQSEQQREGHTPEHRDDHKAAKNKRDRHSINFSFVSWRDSVPGQEGCNALDESDLDALSCSYLSPPTGDEIEARDDEAPMMTEEGDGSFFVPAISEGKKDGEDVQNSLDGTSPPVTDENTEINESAPCHDDAATNSLPEFPLPPHSPIIDSETIKPNQSPHRRRIILYSKTNDGVNTTFEEADMDTSLPHPPIKHDKHFMSKHVTTSKGKARYVVKIISPHIIRGDFSKFLQAAADMATETYFFSVLNHSHILKMRAVGQSDMFSPSFFLVLDRLYETLDHKIAHSWKKHAGHLENDFFVWGRYRKNRSFWMERVGVARDLAGALSYLHEMCIIYRDLKPENVGFDSKGVAKLFDFGLAKQVSREDEKDGTYRLTANTGSLRYMAPEVGNGWPYNFNADSYSFTILLWEMLALEMSFASYTAQEIVNMVRKWGERPKLKDEWSDILKEGMKNGWDSNFRKRPMMKDFVVLLELEMHEQND